MKPDEIDLNDPHDPIAVLRAELRRVQPPAGYVARLRQRVDAEAVTPARAGWWRWAVPVAAVAVALVAFTMNRPAPQQPDTSSTRVALPSTGPVVQSSPNPIAVPPTRAAQPTAPKHRDTAAVQPTAEPMPEIITNQAEVLRAMWSRAAPKASLVESSVPPPDPAAEIVVAPIEVSPIVVKPLPGTVAPGGVIVRLFEGRTK